MPYFILVQVNCSYSINVPSHLKIQTIVSICDSTTCPTGGLVPSCSNANFICSFLPLSEMADSISNLIDSEQFQLF